MDPAAQQAPAPGGLTAEQRKPLDGFRIDGFRIDGARALIRDAGCRVKAQLQQLPDGHPARAWLDTVLHDLREASTRLRLVRSMADAPHDHALAPARTREEPDQLQLTP